MFLFPVIYILSFIGGLGLLAKKNVTGFLLFSVLGLSVYMHALSVSFMLGFGKFIIVLQWLKELIVLATLIVVLSGLKEKPRLHKIDKLMAIFFFGCVIYLLLPIGSYGIYKKLIAFKVLCMFPVIYFLGRFCRAETINLNKVFSFITLVSVLAAVVALIEAITYTHIHTKTGFIDFQISYLNGEMSGNYGLAWTFEAENGMKRFGSIFNSPLEFANEAIIALAASFAMASYRKYKFDLSNYYVLAFLSSFICIILALSRGPFVGYFLLIYAFAWLTRNRILIRNFHICALIIVVYVAFFLKGGLFDLIVATLNFESSSSMGHLIEWLKGINAMIANPMGLGLGASGSVAAADADNVGGENQLIIIGVQVGVVLMALYAWIYIQIIVSGIKAFRSSHGKKKRIIMFVVLAKIGLIIPWLSSYLDSSNYITYTSYFLTGLMVNLMMQKSHEENKARLPLTVTQPAI